MKRITLLLVMVACGLAIGSGLFGSRLVSAQEGLKRGTVLKRTELKGAPGWEAILVEREVPAGAESGKHTQGGNEIAYIQEGSVILEVEGKPPVTLKAGEAFTTSAGEVHNVKNASTAPAKALVFYVAKKGASMEELSVPAK